MYFKNKNLHQFSLYMTNTTFDSIDKFAGQLRYICDSDNGCPCSCNQQLEFVFLVIVWVLGGCWV